MKRIVFLISLAVFILFFSLVACPDDFLATRPAIIHQSDNSDSPSLTGKNVAGTYLKVRTPDGIEGWVYKGRGKIIYTGSSASSQVTYHFYFGNLHSHVSELSKEKNIPQSTFAEAFTYAKTQGGLDFIAGLKKYVKPHKKG
jgi:hypothetical protein